MAVNSIALGGLLFLLSSGFSLIFGLMRIPNLMHGSFFMLGAYFGVTLLAKGVNFWVAALASAAAMAVIGGLIERFLLRRLAGEQLPQVLLTLGFAFIIGDVCLMLWTGDPWQPATPEHLRGVVQVAGLYFPIFPAGDRGGCRRHRHRAVAAGRLDEARRHDPRRRRRCADRPRGRHQGIAALHAGVRAGRGAGGLRRSDGRAVSLGLSRASTSRCCRWR